MLLREFIPNSILSQGRDCAGDLGLPRGHQHRPFLLSVALIKEVKEALARELSG